MDKQQIPAGYKQTELGVIPEDWENIDIGSVAEFVGGSQPPKSTFKSTETIGYIRLIQIRDYKKDTYITFIPENLAQKKCDATDIMIGRYGPPIFQILRGIKGAYNVALIKAIPNQKIEKDFLFYTLKSEKLFQVMEILSQRSSGQTGVDLPALKAYPLALPPKQEQTAIANALSDVDALIAALEKIIDKKTAIKTATMQQLLTGKKRLPPFDQLNAGYQQTELGEIPKDWEVCSLDQLASVGSGGTPSTSMAEYWNGDINWCTPTDITSLRGRRYLYTTSRKITKLGVSNSAAELLPTGTIVMTSRATIGECAITTGVMTTNQGFKNFICHSGTNNEFLYYLLCSMKERFIGLCSGSTFLEISTTQIRSVCVAVPKRAEQTAIANVLSDMDTELDALQQRLAKTQHIKQGMMQELLTGKTRMV